MENEFATEDIRDVFSKIMKFMEEEEESEEIIENTKHLPEKAARVVKPKKIQRKVEYKEPLEEKESPVEKSSNKTISADRFQNTTYARMQARQQAVEEKLKKNAKLLEEKRNENIKSKPDINKKSKNTQLQPISQRYDSIIETKKRKLCEMTEKLNSERNKIIDKELTFHPNISKSQEGNIKEFDDILYRMKEWEEKKNLKALMKKEEIEEKLKEVLTFKPNLCENSVKLVAEHHEQKDVGLRLFETKKNPVIPEFYPFTPSLSTGTKKLARTRSETEVFSRLFTSQKDLLSIITPNSPKEAN